MRTVDEAIAQAWRDAAQDLGIRVIAPITLTGSAGETTFEAHIVDFGGPKGIVVTSYHESMHDEREAQGYFRSNLAECYRKYDRKLFIDTLNDWGWYGPTELRPEWYTGQPWS